jgi:general secretion pathway protein D
MLAKLNFLQSKYVLLIAFMVILSQPLNAAKSCDYRVFNIKTSDKVTGIELLTQIADSCDFSIIIKDTFASTLVQKKLYGINIKNLSLDEIFEVLISDNDLYYEYNKNLLKISALKTKTFKVDYVNSVRSGTANLNASVDITIAEGDTGATASTGGDHSVNSVETFDFWSTMLAEITALMNTGAEEYVAKAPMINSNAGLVTITGTKQQLKRVETYVKLLQKSLHKQVLIDVSILAVVLNEGSETGINWKKFNLKLDSVTTVKDTKDFITGAAGSTVNMVNDAVFTMDGLISFLNTNGDTKVVSSPKILTMNNQQALITIGDNINYRVKSTENSADATGTVSESFDNFSIFIGVLLNITPEITEDNEIILRINPAVSSFKYADDDVRTLTGADPREIAPDTSEKKLSTVVKVKNGNTIILGGLITHTEGVSGSNVPLLSDIPLLGRAFQHESITKKVEELIFIITPRIIGAKDDTKATLKDLGFSKRIYDQ